MGWMVAVLFALAALGAIARAALPELVRDYVNRTLDRNPMYAGEIGGVEIHLWRGAYTIQDIRLSKTTGNVPVPFFSAKRVDFAMQWEALVRGRMVGRVLLDKPEINFVAAPTEGDTQTGDEEPWLETIRDLFPFTINSAIIQDGSVHFRTYEARKPMDVYLSRLNGSINNLSNIRRETNPLVATVQASARAMDQAKLELIMTLDPFSYRPTFHLALRLLGLEVTTINDLALTYGKFDFKRGWFDLIVEVDSKEGAITGYIKPLFRNLKVLNVGQDIQGGNVIQFFWQALVGAAASALKNHASDQLGTLIPFTGDASGRTKADILATVGNLLRNAFVRAYLPQLEQEQDANGSLQFEAPEITETWSTVNVAR